MTANEFAPEFRRGIMNMTEAARYLAVSQQTFHRWARGYPRGQALLHLADEPTEKPYGTEIAIKIDTTVATESDPRRDTTTVGPCPATTYDAGATTERGEVVVIPRRHRGRVSSGRRAASVSFITLTEAYVLQALRTAGVQVRKIRPALAELQREFGTEYALTAPNLATDGIDVLWDFSKTPGGRGLIEARTGQTVMRAIVEDYLTYITREGAGRPTRLQLQSCEPSKVIVDPRYGFGQPRFGVSGARMIDVAAMLKAGETAEVVAEEFGISVHDVGTAARVLLGHAA